MINTDIETIVRLSKLSSFDYDRVRCDEANNLKVLVSTLDEAVKKAREQDTTQQDHFIVTPTMEAWPEHVDGNELLISLTDFIKKYIALNEQQAITIALWIIFTYCIDAFHVSPILNISSPEKRCGKSTLILLLQFLVKQPMPSSNITAAAIFRTVELYHPTLLIDEADTFIRNDKLELRGIINSGHTRTSAFVMRIVGQNNEPRQFSTWCAKCIAGIGNLPDTINDRSIIIKLNRKKPDEKIEKLRFKDELKFLEIKRKCLRFATDNLTILQNTNPKIPATLNDRAADNWEPLLAIAHIAGERWHDISNKAFHYINKQEPEYVSMPTQLLSDIKKVFDSIKADKISSTDLVNTLCSDNEAPWKTYNQGDPISQRQLASKLRNFDIKSQDIRFGDVNLKGYYKKSFTDAFARYIPTNLSATPRQPSVDAALSQNSRATKQQLSRIKNGNKPLPNGHCSAVADEYSFSEQNHK